MVPGKETNSTEPTFERLRDLKCARRDDLNALSPDDAQAVVEGILHPRLWRIEDPNQLAWPGDLADDERGG